MKHVVPQLSRVGYMAISITRKLCQRIECQHVCISREAKADRLAGGPGTCTSTLPAVTSHEQPTKQKAYPPRCPSSQSSHHPP